MVFICFYACDSYYIYNIMKSYKKTSNQNYQVVDAPLIPCAEDSGQAGVLRIMDGYLPCVAIKILCTSDLLRFFSLLNPF